MNRRRIGGGLLGAAAVLLAVPTTTALSSRHPTATGETDVRALDHARAAVVEVACPTSTTTSTTTTAPPPPPPTATCPVAGPVEFVDSWGNGRSGGRRHQGVDMLAPLGTPVVAPVAGTVTHRDNPVGGRSFHLAGDDGIYYYGTHLAGYGASGRVPVGTVIGYVGDSGNARGTPHLHFEIHPDGEGSPAVNPFPTVALLCAAPSAPPLA